MRRLILGVVLCLSLVAASACFQALPVQPVQAAGETGYGAEVNPTGSPLGGGSGYNSIIDPAQADFLVTTRSELLNALSKAVSGQIIYVADDASIDMTGCKDINIAAGVTLASGRGRNGSSGGLIYTNDHKPSSSSSKVFNKFMFLGDNVRLTGLRLRGDDSEIRSNAYEYELWIGFSARGTSGIEVDNCEIYNWSEAGVAMLSGGEGYVHHNYIHHCRRTGFGYGVAAAGGTALIEANIFDYNRHSIMGARGYPLSNYEARYNLVLENANGTLFDMHGGNDVSDASVPAGGTVIIHHNTFTRPGKAVNIRGIPANEVRVYANWSWSDPSVYSSSSVFRQTLDNIGYTPYQKMKVYDNWFGTSAPPNPANSAPATPAAPTGTTSGQTDVSYTYWARTTDPEGDTITYTFDWGDGTNAATRAYNSGSTASATHRWGEAGTYLVKVSALDSNGAVSARSAALTVNITSPDQPPLVPSAPSGSTAGEAGVSYTYETSSTDPEGDDIRYTFDWGDGSTWTTVPVTSGNVTSASHIWLEPGDYVVRVQAKDSKGAVSDWSPAITVNVTALNRPPLDPQLPSGPTSGQTGTSYTYEITTTDPDEDTIRYSFDWGDGSSWTTVPVNSGETASASHIWLGPGDYEVKVQAKDSGGATSAWSPILTVSMADPEPADVVSPNNPPITPLLFPGALWGRTGTSYTFGAFSTDPEGDEIHYTFDWGDGSDWTTVPAVSGVVAYASHSWVESGVYVVRVKATDFSGAASEWSSLVKTRIKDTSRPFLVLLTVTTITIDADDLTARQTYVFSLIGKSLEFIRTGPWMSSVV